MELLISGGAFIGALLGRYFKASPSLARCGQGTAQSEGSSRRGKTAGMSPAGRGHAKFVFASHPPVSKLILTARSQCYFRDRSLKN
jgi:hypothetical protein